MSRENVELLAELWGRWQRGDASWTDKLDPQLEWDISAHPLPDFPDRGSGREEFLRHFAEYLAGWVDYRSTVVETIDVGDDVVTVLHETARLRDSQSVLDRKRTQVWTVRDGQVRRFRAFESKQAALQAVSLAE